MKRNLRSLKLLTGAVILLLARWSANAQGDALTYQAYLDNSQALWERAVEKSKASKFDVAIARYGQLNSTMAAMDEDTFDKYYDPLVDLLKELIDEEDHEAECKAILSSVLGLAIAYDSWKGMFLGPKSGALIDEASEMEPDNPLVRKLYGGSKLYTPAMFGGDAGKALDNFREAIELFQAKGDTINNWWYLDTLVHLGMACEKLGKTDEAIAAYEAALAAEPEFGWVKQSLLPAARKTIREE